MTVAVTSGAPTGALASQKPHLKLISGTQEVRPQTPHFPRVGRTEPRPLGLWPVLARFPERNLPNDPGPVGLLAAHLRRHFGIHLSAGRQRIYRWLRRGLTVREADKLAISLRCHPSEIWGDDWWAIGPLEVDEEGQWS